MKQRLFFAAESFNAKDSGIGRVARLCARVMSEFVERGTLDVSYLALNDKQPCTDFGSRSTVANGSRLKFVLEANKALLQHSHFLYDFLGMARAHNKSPWPRRPFMVWIHGIEVWPGAAANRLEIARQASFFVVNTSFSRQRAAQNHPMYGDARVCWLATETDERVPMRSVVPSRPTLTILGRMEPGGYKGHRELIECWPEVVAQVPDARLVVAGGGPGRDEYRKLGAASPVASHIEFPGFVPEEELAALWNESSLFAMPSRGEGFGLVYIEAMRQGIPVLGSVHDAAQEVNVDGVTGFNVNLDQPGELAGRVVELLSNEALLLEMGQNGQQRWLNHFTYSAFRDRFAPLLKEFLQRF
ncbi:MAG: glycosyltransferase family 1 protein [Deltaproteobacteria bacterium]|nr:MAG: glycosyltransferase family 1 protein [Deltaproteobacteria bacterium]